MSLSGAITNAVYNETFLTFLGGIIILLSLLLIIFIFIELRVKKAVKIKLNEKGIAYLKRIDLLTKSRKKPRQEIRELNIIIKDFLKDYLKLSSPPTYGETLEMIQEKQNVDDIKQLCNEASSLIYAGEEPTEQKVNKILELFEYIIKYRLIKLDEAKAKEIQKILEKTKESIIDEKKIRIIMSAIKSGKKDLFQNNLQTAYKSYSIVTAIYRNLNAKEKSICRNKIMDFYNDIAKRTSPTSTNQPGKFSNLKPDQEPLPI